MFTLFYSTNFQDCPLLTTDLESVPHQQQQQVAEYELFSLLSFLWRPRMCAVTYPFLVYTHCFDSLIYEKIVSGIKYIIKISNEGIQLFLPFSVF